jgi:hypothetical protein
VSPTAPTFSTLNDQLTKAHRRIRELEARETELLAHNRTLRAVITEITHDDDPRTAAAVTSSSNDDSDGFGIVDRPGKHTHQRPRQQSQTPAVNPAPTGVSVTGTNRAKTRRFPYV